jgi:hypothetical protein
LAQTDVDATTGPAAAGPSCALERNDPIPPSDTTIGLLTLAGAVLAALTAVLILVD